MTIRELIMEVEGQLQGQGGDVDFDDTEIYIQIGKAMIPAEQIDVAQIDEEDNKIVLVIS